MKHFGLMAATAMAAFGATGAAAQDKLFTETILSYSGYSDDFEDYSQTSLSFLGAYDFGAFDLRGGFVTSKLDFDGGDATISSLNLNGGYDITPAFSVNLAYQYIDIDGSDASTTELSGTYDGGPFWVTAFYGQNSDDVFIVVAEDYYGLAGGYDFGQGTEVALGYYTSDEDLEDVVSLSLLHNSELLEVSVDVITIDGEDSYLFADGSYQVTPQIAVLAGFIRVDFGGDDQASGFSLGAAYEFSPALEVFGKLGRYDAFGTDVDEITVGLSYKTGTRTLRDEGSYERIIEPLLGANAFLIF